MRDSTYETRCCSLFASLSLFPSLLFSFPPPLFASSLSSFFLPFPFFYPSSLSSNRSMYMTFVDRFLATIRSRDSRNGSTSLLGARLQQERVWPASLCKNPRVMDATFIFALLSFRVHRTNIIIYDILSKTYLQFYLLSVSFLCNHLFGLFIDLIY